MADLIFQWIDILWIPAAFFSVHKTQRIKAVIFVGVCLFVMRLQIELINSTGYTTGFTPFMTSDVHHRALIIYSVFIMLFLILSYYSPHTKGIIYQMASLSIFFMAFITSMIIMAL